MQMCPFCNKVYDESEYTHCPYCSGELEEDDEERDFMKKLKELLKAREENMKDK